MRLLIPLALLLVVSACERSNRAPRVAPAAIPPPSLSTAPPSAEATGAATTEGVVATRPAQIAATAPRRASPAAAAVPSTGTDDSRWIDIDENDPALSEFRAQQEQRDRELLQRDAAEAARGGNAPARREPEPAPYRDDAPRYGEELPPDEMPPDEYYPPVDGPLPDDEYYGDDEYDPPPEDDYDPRYDDRYQR